MTTVTLRPGVTPLLVPGSILRREDLEILDRAEVLLEEAARLRAEAEVAASEAAEKARRQGLEKGLEEGRAEAALQHWKTVLATARYLSSAQDALLDTVVECVRRTVLDLPPRERMQQLLGKALGDLAGSPRITVSVAPSDSATVQQVLGDLAGRLQGVSVEVKVRPDLDEGACVLESPLGIVDASLESQLASIRSAVSSAATPLA